MDPEYELAIKISEYFEFLWDGRLPAWSSDGESVSRTFLQLIPEIPGQPDRATGSDAAYPGLREKVLSGEHDAIRDVLIEYLKSPALRKSRLRRATKTSGLWMRAEIGSGLDRQIADRYVVPICSGTDGYVSAQRQYKPKDPFKEDSVLDELSDCTSKLIAQDLLNVNDVFRADMIATAVFDPSTGSAVLTIAALQFHLSSYFFRYPDRLTAVARALEYMPSFTGRLADAVVKALPASSEDKRRFTSLDRFAYRIAARVLHYEDPGRRKGNFAMGFAPNVRVSVDLRALKSRPRGGAELVAAVVAVIEKMPPPLFEPRIRVSSDPGEDVWFEAGMTLLGNMRWSVLVADTFGVPVPFGVALHEELDEIERSRFVRDGNPPDENPYGRQSV